jgi:death-on-curing protein
MTYRLSAALIENAHDLGIAMVWPGIEPVGPGTCLDFNLLYSAAEQPYQHCFGCEVYPTLAAKAGYLFVHLATGHIFSNGNKRTATLCLDAFLLINSVFLTLSNEEVHNLALNVASFGERGEQFSDVLASTIALIERNIIPLSAFRTLDSAMYRYLHRRKRIFRDNILNQPNAPLTQRQ